MSKLILFLLCAFSAHAQFVGSGHRVIATVPGAICTPVTGYAHCRSFTVAPGQVTGTLTNFPVLASATLGSSRIQNANCFDVVFTSDFGGTTKVPWELEKCTQASGAILAWVKMASLVTGATFFVSYDNAGITTAQNTGALAPTNVWSAYLAVFHLPDGTTLNANDSTALANNLTNVGSVTAAVGQIDGAASFSGSNHLDGANYSALNGASQATFSYWIKPISMANGDGIFSQWSGAGTIFNEFISTTGQLVTNLGGGTVIYDDPAATMTVGSWTKVDLVFDGTQSTDATRWITYINGAAVSSIVPTSPIPTTLASAAAGISIAPLDSTRTNSVIDELRISTASKTALWVSAEYNNQFAPGTFLTVGSEI